MPPTLSLLERDANIGFRRSGSAAQQRIGDIVAVTGAKEVCRAAVNDGCAYRAGVQAGNSQEAETEQQHHHHRARAGHGECVCNPAIMPRLRFGEHEELLLVFVPCIVQVRRFALRWWGMDCEQWCVMRDGYCVAETS